MGLGVRVGVAVGAGGTACVAVGVGVSVGTAIRRRFGVAGDAGEERDRDDDKSGNEDAEHTESVALRQTLIRGAGLSAIPRHVVAEGLGMRAEGVLLRGVSPGEVFDPGQ